MEGHGDSASKVVGLENFVSQDLENRFDLDCGTCGERGEAESRAGMEAIASLAEDFVQEVGGSVDYQVLLYEIQSRVDAAKNLDDAEAVEGAMGVPDRVQDFGDTLTRCGIALLCCDVSTELALEGTDMAGTDQLVSALDAEIEVAGRLGFEGDVEALGNVLRVHERGSLVIVVGSHLEQLSYAPGKLMRPCSVSRLSH